MSDNITLKAIFTESKSKLASQLKGLSLPDDSQKVQEQVSDFLSDLLENDSAYRQSLTESENYILQASLRLLQAQQEIANRIIRATKDVERSQEKSHTSNNVNAYYALAGAGIGALAGSLASSWVAIAGAIAGTAIAIYCTAKEGTTRQTSPSNKSTINVDTFIGIIENVCASIDGVIENFRVQVKKVRDVYENREKPTLQGDYSALIEQIANVYNVTKSEQNVSPKVSIAVDMLAESLENYGLKIEGGKIVKD